MKILDIFLFWWVIFALLDPDPATQINADPCGSGSETLLFLFEDIKKTSSKVTWLSMIYNHYGILRKKFGK
jgi:hypothetical protein